MEWLHRGEMDLALIYGPSADLHLTVQSLGRDNIVAVGPRGSGLAQKKQVDIGWLLRQRLVLPSHSHGLRALIEHAAAKKKLKLDVKVEADSFRVLTSLVEEGLGYTLLPPSSVRTKSPTAGWKRRPLPNRRRCANSPLRLPSIIPVRPPYAHHRSAPQGSQACREEGLWDIKC